MIRVGPRGAEDAGGEKMKETILRLSAAIAFAALLQAGVAEARVLKIATISPEGSLWMQKMREGADRVKAKTEGRVKFKFYPGGVMGNDQAVLRKIRVGQLHGGALTSGSVARFFPDSQIYALPMKFRSLAEVDHVRKELDREIMEGLEKSGFVTFGFAEGGFAYIMSTDPVSSVADLGRQKVWVPDNNPAAMEAVRSFEITPIPLPISDVRTGLSTSLIDTVAIAPIGAIVLQWHTQVKYVTELPLIYIYAMMAVDKKQFGRISPSDQEIVRKEMGLAFAEIDRKNREDNVKALSVLKEQGLSFLKPGEAELEEWYARAERVPRRLVESGKLSQGMLDKFERSLAAFRAKEGGTDGQ